MNCSFHLTSCKSTSSLCLRIISTVNFCHVTILILYKAFTLHKICVHQTNFIPWEQAEIFLWRFFHEVVSLDVKFTTERNFTLSEFFVLQIIRNIQIFNFSFRIVVDHKLDRIKYSHHTGTLHLQIFTDTVLKHRIINRALALGNTTHINKHLD